MMHIEDKAIESGRRLDVAREWASRQGLLFRISGDGRQSSVALGLNQGRTKEEIEEEARRQTEERKRQLEAEEKAEEEAKSKGGLLYMMKKQQRLARQGQVGPHGSLFPADSISSLGSAVSGITSEPGAGGARRPATAFAAFGASGRTAGGSGGGRHHQMHAHLPHDSGVTAHLTAEQIAAVLEGVGETTVALERMVDSLRALPLPALPSDVTGGMHVSSADGSGRAPSRPGTTRTGRRRSNSPPDATVPVPFQLASQELRKRRQEARASQVTEQHKQARGPSAWEGLQEQQRALHRQRQEQLAEAKGLADESRPQSAAANEDSKRKDTPVAALSPLGGLPPRAATAQSGVRRPGTTGGRPFTSGSYSGARRPAVKVSAPSELPEGYSGTSTMGAAGVVRPEFGPDFRNYLEDLEDTVKELDNYAAFRKRQIMADISALMDIGWKSDSQAEIDSYLFEQGNPAMIARNDVRNWIRRVVERDKENGIRKVVERASLVAAAAGHDPRIEDYLAKIRQYVEERKAKATRAGYDTAGSTMTREEDV
jgi:hypothetical protein